MTNNSLRSSKAAIHARIKKSIRCNEEWWMMRWCSHLRGPLPISFIFNAIIRDCVRWCLTIAETVALTLSIDFAKSNIWWDSQIYSLVCSRSCHPEIVDPDSEFKKTHKGATLTTPLQWDSIPLPSSLRGGGGGGCYQRKTKLQR